MANTDTVTFSKLSEARAHALALSLANRNTYYTLTNVFGWMVCASQRLNVFAPHDGSDWTGKTGSYWLGGVEKRFSDKQRSAAERATPVMQ